MINGLIIQTLVSGLDQELGESSTYDEDRVQLVTDDDISNTDPNLTISVRDGDIVPVDYEIGQLDASHYRYLMELRSYIKHTDKGEGYQLNRKINKRIRKALFLTGVNSLNSKLLSLEDDAEGVVERISKFNLTRIQPNRAPTSGGFIFLTVMTLMFETESIFA
jgi:hypothetical protein